MAEPPESEREVEFPMQKGKMILLESAKSKAMANPIPLEYRK
jgi:hypothetical protein